MGNKKHGKKGTKVYKTWVSMRGRCYNKNNPEYFRYGARGISICRLWMKFETFYADMGDPGPGLSIERLNNNKGYSKENCIWATPKTQARNRRTTRWIEFNGSKKSLAEWSEITGIDPDTITVRLNKLKWSVQKALTTNPSDYGNKTH